MARRRTHDDVRDELLTIRLTKADKLRLKEQALRHGTTPSGLAEQYVRKGYARVVAPNDAPAPADPVLLAELKRLGNNLNQIAHAVNTNLPPSIPAAAKHMHALLTLIVNDEYLSRRIDLAKKRGGPDDSSTPHAREEFQRNVQIRSERPEG